jgi:Fur family peroxide stress response transcriptional regulator
MNSVKYTSAQVRDLLHERGMRHTRQREDLFLLLVGQPGHHPSAEELFKEIRERDPGISLATVYNTLDALVEAQLIRKIATPGGPGRFDAVMEPHAHLVTADGQVFDVPREISDELFDEVMKRLTPLLEKKMGVKVDRAAVKFFTGSFAGGVVG